MDSERAVAVVGMSCRFPGGEDLEEFWETLLGGKDKVTEVPPERWDTAYYYSPDKEIPGKTYSKHGGFIDRFDEFDSRFFDISEKEASRMDPQQRLLLECTFRALENGGFPLDVMSGSDTGVYIGSMNSDFSEVLGNSLESTDNYFATGTASSMLSNKVSYVFNLLGPSLTLDSACSSSVMAIHLGAASILAGDCGMAVCGGVSVILSPSVYVRLSKAKMVSPVGKCHSFSANADGYTRGEGCGVVILKGLKEAIKDGDYIWGIIGTASNQDGQTVTPITSPSSAQQMALLRNVYRKYNVNVKDIQYVEAHGTGTPAGDPVELNSLGKVISSDRNPSDPLVVGSVKSNIGHLESAAGVASLVKVLLMMKNAKIVPSLHSQPPNDKILFKDYNLLVPTQLLDWPVLPHPHGYRLACINNFGFGGTNTHIVVRDYSPQAFSPTVQKMSRNIIPISAKTEEALLQSLEFFTSNLKQAGDSLDLTRLVYTSTVRRTHFRHRLALSGNDVSTILRQAELKKETYQRNNYKERNIIFISNGMGSHWQGMGTDLMSREPTFKTKMEEIDQEFKQEAKWSIIDALFSNADLTCPEVGQAAIFAIQVSLAYLLESWGIQPSLVIGHSMGEVSAACISGMISLRDGVSLIHKRGYWSSRAKGGSMMAVGNTSKQQVEEVCSRSGGKVGLAAVNSAKSFTLSGDKAAIDELYKAFKMERSSSGIGKDRILVRKLHTQTAFHSQHMDSILLDFSNSLNDFQSHPEKCKMISTVTGGEVTAADVRSPDYWSRSVRQPVLFEKALSSAVDAERMNIVVELGPTPVLQKYIVDICEDVPEKAVLGTMTPHQKEDLLTRLLQECYQAGIDVKWNAVYNTNRFPPVSLPRYQLQSKKIWFEPLVSKKLRQGDQTHHQQRHPFIVQEDDEQRNKFEVQLNSEKTSFVYDHMFSEKVLLPGATHIEAALTACSTVCDLHERNEQMVVQTEFMRTFYLSGTTTSAELRVTVNVIDKRYLFTISDGDFVLAKGYGSVSDYVSPDKISYATIMEKCDSHLCKDEFYSIFLKKKRLFYKNSLKCIQHVDFNERQGVGTVHMSDFDSVSYHNCKFHPACLDQLLQMTLIFIKDRDDIVFPVFVESTEVFRKPLQKMKAYIELVDRYENGFQCRGALTDLKGTPLVVCRGIINVTPYETSTELISRKFAYQTTWRGAECPLNLRPETNPFFVAYIGTLPDSLSRALPSGSSCVAVNVHLEPKISEFTSRKLPLNIMFVVECCQSEISLKQSEGLHHFLITRCDFLRNVLKVMASNAASIPRIHVVTIDKDLDIGFEENLAANTIWGMVKTLKNEIKDNRINLIHVPEFGVESFRTMFNVLQNSEWAGAIVVRGNRVFSNEVKPRGSSLSELQSRECIADEDCCYRTVNSPEGMYNCPALSPPESAKEHIVVKVLRSLTLRYEEQSFDNGDHPFYGKYRERPVIGADFYGVVTRDPLGQYICGQNVMVCCLHEIGSEISVPRECVTCMPQIQSDFFLSLYIIALVILKDEVEIKQKEQFSVDRDSLPQNIVGALAFIGRHLGATFVEYKDLGSCSKDIRVLVTGPLSGSKVQLDGVKEWVMVGINTSQVTASSYLHNSLTTRHVVSVPSCLQFVNIRRFLPYIVKIVGESRILPFVQASAEHGNRDTIPQFYDDVKPESFPLKLRRHELFYRNGVYIITGGNRGLGWEIAKYMVTAKAGAVVTVSRSDVSKEQSREIKKICDVSGSAYLHVLADVCQIEDVRKALQVIKAEFPEKQLKGIFYGAAVLADGLSSTMSLETFAKATKPKIEGAWNFHQLTSTTKLQYFVLFSSLVSVIGNAGQTNYAAGNAFLDALAHFRRRSGLPGQSINFGALDVGMLSNNTVAQRHLSAEGLQLMSRDEIFRSFEYALLANDRQVILAKIHWPQFLQHQLVSSYKNMIDFKELLLTFQLKIKPGPETATRRPTATSLSARERVMLVLSETLVYDKNDIVSDGTTLLQLGIDSVSVTSVRNQLKNDAALDLPFDFLLSDDATISALVSKMESCGETDSVNTSSTKVKHQQQVMDDIKQRLWTPSQIFRLKYYTSGGSSALNMTTIFFQNEESIRFEKFKERMGKIVDMKEALRTIIVYDEGTLRPEVVHDKSLQMLYSEHVNEEEARTSVSLSLAKEFDLLKELPIRVHYAKAGDKVIVGMSFSHLMFDYRSLYLILRDLTSSATNQQTAVQSPPLSQFTRQYWQIYEAKKSQMEEFWLGVLPEEPPNASFSDRKPDRSERDYRHRQHRQTVSGDSYNLIMAFVRRAGMTLFQYLCAAHFLLQTFLTGETETALISEIDLRHLVPGFGETVGDLCQIVLLPGSSSNRGAGIGGFLENTKKMVRSCVQNALFPDTVGAVYKSEEEQASPVGKHLLNLNGNMMSELYGCVLWVKEGYAGGYFETCVYVEDNSAEENLKLTLCGNQSLMSDRRCEEVLAKYVQLLYLLPRAASKTVGELADSLQKTRLGTTNFTSTSVPPVNDYVFQGEGRVEDP